MMDESLARNSEAGPNPSHNAADRSGRSGPLRVLGLMLLLVVCLGTGGLGAVATTSEIPTWYAGLVKPSWNPPSWVFGPVWTTLYVLMAIAAWLVWSRAGYRSARVALLLFALQLMLNGAWSWIFFGMHRPGWALGEILLLWIALAATLIAFARHSRLAAALLVPYLAWVSFAAILNGMIWRLNA